MTGWRVFKLAFCGALGAALGLGLPYFLVGLLTVW